MGSSLIQAAGGLGLFLLGMSIMTDGLRSLADDRLRSLLARSTKGPLSGVCTGAVTTAMVQSSSATTVAAVGFVHAGLLTFTESLGIIFGANIGTTITGWLVALIGFKLKLGQVVLPLILVGTLLRLMTRGRLRALGTSLAGFGLIFVGITALQNGMTVFEGVVTPDRFPPDTILGRLLLVLVGVAITLVTQSSSAGVATALTAVYTDTISLGQAAAMVIGMDFGTTVTAALATVGGNVQARRTGFAHVIYNAITAMGAFALLSPYLSVIGRFGPNTVEPELALVGFHTLFNAVGVVAILPFTRTFARFIERLFPDRGHPLVRRLDPKLCDSPDVALQVVMATLHETVQAICRALLPILRDPRHPTQQDLTEVDSALEQTREFLEQIRVEPSHRRTLELYSRAAHVLDHLRRLSRRAQDYDTLSRLQDDPQLAAMTQQLANSMDALATAKLPISEGVEARIHHTNQRLKIAMRRYRVQILRRTIKEGLPTRVALQRMDAARCVRRLGYHAWRIADHAGAGHAPSRGQRPSDEAPSSSADPSPDAASTVPSTTT